MKKSLPELKPTSDQGPGYALLTLQGWETPAASLEAVYEVCLQRNQDSRFLGAGGQWSATQTWHHVDATASVNECVALVCGPHLVDPLVENPQMTYLLQARYGDELAQGVLRIREGVLSSHAAGQTGEAVTHVAKPVVPPQVISSPDTTPAAPAPTEVSSDAGQAAIQGQPPPRQSSAPLIAAILALLVLLIGGYLAWNWYQAQQSPPVASATGQAPAVATTTPTIAPPAPPPAPPACSAEALAATKDDLLFIQSCLKTNPESAQVLSVIELAKTAKRCDVAQRLYAFKGQAGDLIIALAYAREFDPKTFVAGCVAAPDKDTALYWYDLVLSKDANQTQAKERADALRK